MPKYITFLFVLLSFSTIAQQKIDEELVIFVQKNTYSEFTKANIKQLVEDMKGFNIATKIINIDKVGAPKEIGFTPHLVYRNYIGNKIYKGRYTSHGRIRNFIRTIRHLPLDNINYEEKNIFVWKQNRCNILFKLKITAAKGALPQNFDLVKFEKEYLDGLKKGFEGAVYASNQKVNNSDEMFYYNFYPYLAEDGKVYVSYEVFSHYDCINPIHQQFDSPAIGNSVVEGFEKAANKIFLFLKNHVKNSQNGDAMNFVSKDIKTINWKNLNLKKLEAPQKHRISNIKDIEFPKAWSLVGPVDDDTPLLAFHFPAPLLQYGGELKKAVGNIFLQEDKNLKDASGKFVVEVSSLEMGVASLNGAVKETMLFVDKFPTAQLVFLGIKSNDFKLEVGKITRADVKAELTIVHKSDTVIATTQFEPFLNDDGELLLHITTQFVAEDLKGRYQIDGPDGPDDANNQMYFDANFIMKAMPTNE